MAKHERHPQWLNLTSVVESAINTFTESETKIPARIGARQVIEVLAIEFEFAQPVELSPQVIGETNHSIQMTTRTKDAPIRINDKDLISKWKPSTSVDYAEATETGGAAVSQEQTKHFDYAAGAGGFLVGSTSIFLGIQSNGESAVVTGYARMLYKLVTVSAEELLGLVSQ